MQVKSKDPAEVANSNNTGNRIIKRFGGRHMIFRTRTGGWALVPRPYLLISSFRGPVWVFYGVGQVWLTHRKIRQIGAWIVRAPRFASRRLIEILDQLQGPLAEFIAFCESHQIQGTIVIEKRVIEFHWTFGFELDSEKKKPEHASEMDSRFSQLVAAFKKTERNEAS